MKFELYRKCPKCDGNYIVSPIRSIPIRVCTQCADGKQVRDLTWDDVELNNDYSLDLVDTIAFDGWIIREEKQYIKKGQ